MAGSKIPRIGTKPYARPPEKEKQESEGKKPVHKLFMTKRPTSSGSALVSWREILKSVRVLNGPEDKATTVREKHKRYGKQEQL